MAQTTTGKRAFVPFRYGVIQDKANLLNLLNIGQIYHNKNTNKLYIKTNETTIFSFNGQAL